MTWKPKVTPLEQPKATPEGPVATKTSLAAAGKQPTKYNSPINLYNEEAIAEALSSQAEVLGNTGKGCLGVNFKKHDHPAGANKDSTLVKMVMEMDRSPKPSMERTTTVYSGAMSPSEMIGTPETPLQGASFKVLERFLSGGDEHGYYNVNDKMYCDIHAKQAAKHNPPAPNMVPVTVKPGAAPPHGAMSAPQAPASVTPVPAPVKAPAPAPTPAKAPAFP